MIDERRKDPRTSRTFSLGNLLRTRAESLSWEVAIVGTRDGLLLASSRGAQDRFAQRAAAHVSARLFAGEPARSDGPFDWAPPLKPEVKLAGERFTVRGQPVFLAVVARGDGPARGHLDEAARAVERILNEPARRGAR
jgi:hypothetical protein